jgi:FkbM family methyltransferase
MYDRLIDYLRVLPERPIDGIRLYFGYALAAWCWILLRDRFRTVGQFLPGSSLLHVQRDGLSFVVRPGTGDLGYLSPTHKPAVAAWFRPSVGQVVVDVGAHIGFFTVVAAQHGARVCALEPNPETFSVLVTNVQRNGFSNVKLFPYAAGNRAGVLPFYVPGRRDASGSLHATVAQNVGGSNLRTSVRVVRLDDLLPSLQVSQVDWLLIDTEGYEAEVLSGAKGLLDRCSNVIVEVALGESQAQCKSILEDHGMRLLEREPQSGWNEYWLLCHDDSLTAGRTSLTDSGGR